VACRPQAVPHRRRPAPRGRPRRHARV